jgi:hypothetical protein
MRAATLLFFPLLSLLWTSGCIPVEVTDPQAESATEGDELSFGTFPIGEEITNLASYARSFHRNTKAPANPDELQFLQLRTDHTFAAVYGAQPYVVTVGGTFVLNKAIAPTPSDIVNGENLFPTIVTLVVQRATGAAARLDKFKGKKLMYKALVAANAVVYKDPATVGGVLDACVGCSTADYDPDATTASPDLRYPLYVTRFRSAVIDGYTSDYQICFGADYDICTTNTCDDQQDCSFEDPATYRSGESGVPTVSGRDLKEGLRYRIQSLGIFTHTLETGALSPVTTPAALDYDLRGNNVSVWISLGAP